MWPGLVGKEEGSAQPPISLEKMLTLTAQSNVNGRTYDGVDMFLYFSHLDIDASDDEICKLADHIQSLNLKVGTVVAPIWKDTNGGSAMGSPDDIAAFLAAVKKACRYTQILNEQGVRSYGNIRIDSATSVEDWIASPLENTKKIAHTFREAGKIAADFGERLAAEGEICWGGMHSWKDMLDLLEETGMPNQVGFQADLAHTYLYLLGYNAEDHRLISNTATDDEFWAAYKIMTDALRPWTIDFHVAQNDGSVHGSGAHDKTGRHCKADDPNGKLDIAECSKYWLLDADGQHRKEIDHLCWDGCMFDNEDLLQQSTWNRILDAMTQVK